MTIVRYRIELDCPEDYIVYQAGSAPDSIEILDIQVLSERRKGRGTELVELMFQSRPEETRLVYAITRSENLIAQEFYEHLQFHLMGVLRNFYTYDARCADALVYGRYMPC